MIDTTKLPLGTILMAHAMLLDAAFRHAVLLVVENSPEGVVAVNLAGKESQGFIEGGPMIQPSMIHFLRKEPAEGFGAFADTGYFMRKMKLQELLAGGKCIPADMTFLGYVGWDHQSLADELTGTGQRAAWGEHYETGLWGLMSSRPLADIMKLSRRGLWDLLLGDMRLYDQATGDWGTSLNMDSLPAQG